MLERHIMQAQARAMFADERELNRANQSCDNYGDLGLPPGMSSCESCDNYVGKTYHASSSKGHVCLCARTEPIQSELR